MNMTMLEREVIDNAIDQAKTKIWVTFRKEGIHCFPLAADDPKLADVSFLANPHRHIFHFKVWITVFHDDREIEFIQFKRKLESWYETDSAEPLSLNDKSCEMMSDDLFVKIASEYPNRDVWIDVSEDGENGSYKQYTAGSGWQTLP